MTTSPSEIIANELRGSLNGYASAPSLAAQVVAGLNTAGYIIVEKGSIGRAQREAVAAYREDRPRHYDRHGYCDNPARGY
jgi:hypothetical protein